MNKCAKCGKEFGLLGGDRILEHAVMEVRQYGVGRYLCNKCHFDAINEHVRKKNQPRPEIKCPFCGQMFSPKTKSPTSTGGNIIRGAIFLPWGAVSAVKNKPFVQCPHCKMKIPQG